MKNLQIFVSIVILYLIQSCDYGILYENAQPDGLKNLESFPVYYQGTYTDDSANVSIVILPEKVVKISYFDIASSKAEIDTMPDCRLVGDSLYISDFQKFIPVILKNDSVFGVLDNPDTLFAISKYNVLRRIKRECFINLFHESGKWQVIRLRKIENNGIEFSVVPQKVDFEVLSQFTPIIELKDQKDSVLNYVINPTVKEFKKMIKAGLFTKHEIYYRQNEGH